MKSQLSTSADDSASSFESERDADKGRQFKGMSLAERKQVRRERLIEAGIECYGTQGFFSVTVKDICNEARLTERYFYESFKKSEDLFQQVFLILIERLEKNVKQATLKAVPDVMLMIDQGLHALLKTLKDDPRLARIIYIDAMLVQELHNQATLRETMQRFEQMIQYFIALSASKLAANPQTLSLTSTGLNGYVTQVAIRWVMDGFKQPEEEVLNVCRNVFLALLMLSQSPS